MSTRGAWKRGTWRIFEASSSCSPYVKLGGIMGCHSQPQTHQTPDTSNPRHLKPKTHQTSDKEYRAVNYITDKNDFFVIRLCFLCLFKFVYY